MNVWSKKRITVDKLLGKTKKAPQFEQGSGAAGKEAFLKKMREVQQKEIQREA